MSSNQLPLSNVISISVSQAQVGANEYNTSNLAIFTTEIPSSSWSGLAAGYGLYQDPSGVQTDFGSSSVTAQMADAVFSQQPNILANGGELVVIPLLLTEQTLAFSGVAASGTFEITSTNGSTAAINWNDTAATIQTKLQAVTGQAGWQVSGSIASESLVITCGGTYGSVSAFTISANSLETSGAVGITVTPTVTQAGETIGAAITRTQGLVQYFGILANVPLSVIGQANLLSAAAVVQPLNKIAAFVSYNQADIAPGGMIDLLRTGDFTQTRGLYYGDSSAVGGVTGLNAILMSAAYMGRALSTNFNGSNTTQTMHLKALATIQPDPTMTQTILTTATTAGADTYVSLQGTSCVFCSGANSFFDQVYNLQWLVGALQVAGFNYLAGSSSKIPQTEGGMDGLKGAYRTVLEQAVSNQYCAPGSWTSSTTFGVQADFLANISQRGYYIYSSTIATQLQSARAARQAPLVQIALKEAGALQSSDVIVYVNA